MLVVPASYLAQACMIGKVRNTLTYNVVPVNVDNGVRRNMIADGILTPDGENFTDEFAVLFDTLFSADVRFDCLALLYNQDTGPGKDEHGNEIPLDDKMRWLGVVQRLQLTTPRQTLSVCVKGNHIAYCFVSLPDVVFQIATIDSEQTDIVPAIADIIYDTFLGSGENAWQPFPPEGALNSDGFAMPLDNNPIVPRDWKKRGVRNSTIRQDDIDLIDWKGLDEEYEETGVGLPPTVTAPMQVLASYPEAVRVTITSSIVTGAGVKTSTSVVGICCYQTNINPTELKDTKDTEGSLFATAKRILNDTPVRLTNRQKLDESKYKKGAIVAYPEQFTDGIADFTRFTPASRRAVSYAIQQLLDITYQIP